MTVHQTYCEVPSVIPDVPPYMTVDQTYFEYFCEYKVQTNRIQKEKKKRKEGTTSVTLFILFFSFEQINPIS